MADTSPRAGLLDRATRVFFLARQLAQAFTNEHDRQSTGLTTVDPSAWGRQKPVFEEFCAAVLALREETCHPPDGFEQIAAALLDMAETAKQIRDAIQADDRTWQTLTAFRFHLDTISTAGDEALRRAAISEELPAPSTPAGSAPEPVSTDESSEPVTVENLLDYVIRVRDDLDDDHDTSRDDVLNMIQVAKAYQAARELGLVRAAERPDGLLNRSGARRKLDTLVPLLRARLEPPAAPTVPEASAAPDDRGKPVKPKRSTQRGDGRAKLIAALTAHHNYADGSALNTEAINNNELARRADVSPSTASAFFSKEFDGYEHYKSTCRRSDLLVVALKALNGEYSPHLLFKTISDEGTHNESE